MYGIICESNTAFSQLAFSVSNFTQVGKRKTCFKLQTIAHHPIHCGMTEHNKASK